MDDDDGWTDDPRFRSTIHSFTQWAKTLIDSFVYSIIQPARLTIDWQRTQQALVLLDGVSQSSSSPTTQHVNHHTHTVYTHTRALNCTQCHPLCIMYGQSMTKMVRAFFLVPARALPSLETPSSSVHHYHTSITSPSISILHHHHITLSSPSCHVTIESHRRRI